MTQRIKRAGSRFAISAPAGNWHAVAIALAVIALASIATLGATGRIHGAIDTISPALAQAIRQSLSRATTRTGPDGLKWIEVSDPRSRKSDRLTAAPQR
jgi:hypothetical protein